MMKIEERPIGSVKPYEKNPRVNDDAVEKVAESIREFGFNQPIVVDAEGVVIVGHTRLKAAESLGMKKVPVYVADLTPEKAAAYRLADNKTAEFSFWDAEGLQAELAELADVGFDMAPFGFDTEADDPAKSFFENDVTESAEGEAVAGEDENYLLRIRVPKKFKQRVERYRKDNGDEGFTAAVLAVCGIGAEKEG